MRKSELASILLILEGLACIAYSINTMESPVQSEVKGIQSNIQPGHNILIDVLGFTKGNCPKDLSLYTNNPTGVNWTLSAGGDNQTLYICEANGGTANDPHPATFIQSQNLQVFPGSCPDTSNSTTLITAGPNNSPSSLSSGTITTIPIQITICAGENMPVGTTSGAFIIVVS